MTALPGALRETSAIADRPTGEQLVAAIRRAAVERGVSAVEFARALSDTPEQRLLEIGRARSPRPVTVARVRALIAGEPLPPKQRYEFQLTRLLDAGRERRQNSEARPAPPTAPVDRDPCFKCGVRGDLGCVHRPLEARA